MGCSIISYIVCGQLSTLLYNQALCDVESCLHTRYCIALYSVAKALGNHYNHTKMTTKYGLLRSANKGPSAEAN